MDEGQGKVPPQEQWPNIYWKGSSVEFKRGVNWTFKDFRKLWKEWTSFVKTINYVFFESATQKIIIEL